MLSHAICITRCSQLGGHCTCGNAHVVVDDTCAFNVVGGGAEKELGSIINLYVTQLLHRVLLGKQLPYIATSFVSFLLLVAMAVWLFNIPLKGDVMCYAL